MRLPLIVAECFLMLGLLTAAHAQRPTKEPPPPSWQGIYRSETFVGDKTYRSVVEIRQDGPTVYRVDGHCQGRPMNGIAQAIGDALAIGWIQPDSQGITILRKKNGAIVGQWTSRPGDGELREESWALVPEKINLKVE